MSYDDSILEDYSEWLSSRGREASRRVYCGVARRWLEDPDEIRGLVVNKNYSPNYRLSVMAYLRSFASFTRDTETLEWIRSIKKPAAVPIGSKEPYPFGEWTLIRDEIDDADYLSEPLRVALSILALRGMRCSDVLRLTREDVELALETGTLVYVAKGERRLQYNVGRILQRYLENALELEWPRGYHLWDVVSPHSKPGNAPQTAARYVRKALDQVAMALGIEPAALHSHRFRHTYATYFLQEMQGDPEAIFKLQEQMGWARLETASNYLRRSRRAELDVVEDRLLSRHENDRK